MTNLLGALAVVALLAVVLAQADPDAPKSKEVRLDPTECTAVPPDKAAWVPAEWNPYRAFVKICTVKWEKSPALYLLSIWADDFYKTLPPSAPAVKFPKPLLLSTDGKTLGELPRLFPRDPPTTLEPIFAKWSENFPHEIRLWLDDPAVLGDRYLPPLQWDEGSGKYVQLKRKEKPHEPTSNQH